MKLLRRVNKQLRFPGSRVEKVRAARTSSLLLGAIWTVLAVVSLFSGDWHWSTAIWAVCGPVFLARGILADVELNRREHRNYPLADVDGLREIDGVANH
jgi:hypothetical protein